jgi:hypothetical protein
MSHVPVDMLDHFLVPQLDVNRVILQQDGAHPYYPRDVTRYLNQMSPWPLHSLVTHITRSETHAYFILGIYER